MSGVQFSTKFAASATAKGSEYLMQSECTCSIIRDVLCPAHGDEAQRQYREDALREERHLEEWLRAEDEANEQSAKRFLEQFE